MKEGVYLVTQRIFIEHLLGAGPVSVLERQIDSSCPRGTGEDSHESPQGL